MQARNGIQIINKLIYPNHATMQSCNPTHATMQSCNHTLKGT